MPHGPSALFHPLYSQFRGPLAFNMADDGAGGGNAGGDQGKGDQGKGDGGDQGKKPTPDDTQGRITDLDTKLKAEREEKKALAAKLKEYEDAKKAEEDEKAKKKGDYEKLLADRDGQVSTLTGEKDALAAKLAKYEEHATKQIEDSLKAITDADKQKSAKAMLEGRSLEDQVALLPEVLKLAGSAAPSGFGGPTPQSTTTPSQTEVAQKEARYEELLNKPQKTPQERNEMHRLMGELEKVWNERQQKKRDTK